jgi:hypothetical protein
MPRLLHHPLPSAPAERVERDLGDADENEQPQEQQPHPAQEMEVEQVAGAKLAQVSQPRGPHVEEVVVRVLHAQRVAGSGGGGAGRVAAVGAGRGGV